MVKIRLTRIGKKGAPHYRLIAIQARTKREGRALDYLGYYNPRTNPSTINLEKDKIKDWLGKGAQPTEVVSHILIKAGILAKPKDKKAFKDKPGRKATERAEKAAEKQAEEKPAEAKTEEVKAE